MRNRALMDPELEDLKEENKKLRDALTSAQTQLLVFEDAWKEAGCQDIWEWTMQRIERALAERKEPT